MKVVLTLTLHVDDSESADDATAVVTDNLAKIAKRIVDKGQATADTKLVVESYEAHVQVGK